MSAMKRSIEDIVCDIHNAHTKGNGYSDFKFIAVQHHVPLREVYMIEEEYYDYYFGDED